MSTCPLLHPPSIAMMSTATRPVCTNSCTPSYSLPKPSQTTRALKTPPWPDQQRLAEPTATTRNPPPAHRHTGRLHHSYSLYFRFLYLFRVFTDHPTLHIVNYLPHQPSVQSGMLLCSIFPLSLLISLFFGYFVFNSIYILTLVHHTIYIYINSITKYKS